MNWAGNKLSYIKAIFSFVKRWLLCETQLLARRFMYGSKFTFSGAIAAPMLFASLTPISTILPNSACVMRMCPLPCSPSTTAPAAVAVQIVARRHIIALELRVAVQDGRHLLTGNLLVWRKAGLADTVDDAIYGRPVDCV